MKIIAIANNKGGVAKTTTTINLGAALMENGYRVLLIDMDPQYHLSSGTGILQTLTDHDLTITDVLLEDKNICDAIYTSEEGLEVVPSDIDLSSAELPLYSRISRETVFKSKLKPIESLNYDFVLIDSPPSLGIFALNIFTAATETIIPVSTDYYALQGLVSLLDTMEMVKKHLNPDLEITGILPTKHKPRTKIAKAVLGELPKTGLKIFNSIIEESVKLSEAPSYGQSIIKYAPKSSSAEQYRQFAKEIEETFHGN